MGPVNITINCGQIQITKTADPATADAGRPIGYVVTVSNSGAGPANGFKETAAYEAWSGLGCRRVHARSSSGWSIQGGVLSFGPATLAAGGSTHVHITSPT